MKIGSYAKAIVAALTAGCGALATAVADNVVTPSEWFIVLGAALAGMGVTAVVPNAKKSDDR
ncbi:hypothetical protein [Acrocarpospora sp. B8E8]|uniref:hypothetical protein n=1 Tax=Acrocarpospora sp. B8E8 TaxID=3153572 RepID=UPI00325F4FD0